MPVKLQGGSADHEEEARIEVVPLIDIMFFLLASFMLVSLSMTEVYRSQVNLPKIGTASHDPKPPPVEIAIDANGIITWDKQVVTPTEITDRLKEMPKEELRVSIAMDENSRNKELMEVYNSVRAAGVEKLAFESRNPKQ